MARSVLLALLVAAAPLVAMLDGSCAESDGCVSAACAGHDDDAGREDECPPGCDDGCACCARPAAAVSDVLVPSFAPTEARTVEFGARAERTPPSPEPTELDIVPRLRAAI